MDDLCHLAASYLEPEQVAGIQRAYSFGAVAHEGQTRASGEPYISHPLSVAKILAEMRMDYPTIVAAILHDVIEDTGIAKEQVESEFGSEVAELVDGVSKLTQITFESKAEAQAKSYRKMLMAMSRDIRVILVKLADRLHNMRTLGALPVDKRRKIARETLDIYAPIANRLGLNSIRLELEDLGFATLYPNRYRVLAAQLKKARGHRKQVVKKMETALKRRLRQEGLEGRLVGREKHLYSLYRKMREKRLTFAEVMDVYAFRIVTDTVDSCYRILGAMHNLYKPVPGRFRDYIAIPKSNGYQSLHTVLFGPYGVPIEIQIRTEEMHQVAEAGIAAHWMYKTDEASSNVAQQRARTWMKELLEMQKNAGNSLEFIENVKVDLFPNEVFVFTPAGDIMGLPRGANAVDLAYAVHTDVGNTCIAVKIDRRFAPLRTPLQTGQTVEIVTAPWGRPNANWLNFVVTGKARAGIRSYLKNLRTGESVELGRRLLTQVLAHDNLTIDDIDDERIDALVAELGLPNLDALLEEIGLGRRLAPLVARRLVPARSEGESDTAPARDGQPLYIRGTEGMVVSFGKCCHPIPGDPILGFVSAGRGLVIHTQSCRNLPDYANRRQNWIEVEWEPETRGHFSVEIRVDMANRKGVLATVAAVIADMDANIENVTSEERDGLNSTLKFSIDVTGRTHLARIMRRIRSMEQVSRIQRTRS